MKNSDYRPTPRFISEMIKDRAIVSVKRKYEFLYAIHRMVHFQWP